MEKIVYVLWCSTALDIDNYPGLANKLKTHDFYLCVTYCIDDHINILSTTNAAEPILNIKTGLAWLHIDFLPHI